LGAACCGKAAQPIFACGSNKGKRVGGRRSTVPKLPDMLGCAHSEHSLPARRCGIVIARGSPDASLGASFWKSAWWLLELAQGRSTTTSDPRAGGTSIGSGPKLTSVHWFADGMLALFAQVRRAARRPVAVEAFGSSSFVFDNTGVATRWIQDWRARLRAQTRR